MTPLEINKKIGRMRYDSARSVVVNGLPAGNGVVCFKEEWLALPELRLAENKNWAENIADAWELFDELPPATKLEKCASGISQFWCCSYEEYIPYFYGEDETAPLAIAKAWLAWKESKK